MRLCRQRVKCWLSKLPWITSIRGEYFSTVLFRTISNSFRKIEVNEIGRWLKAWVGSPFFKDWENLCMLPLRRSVRPKTVDFERKKKRQEITEHVIDGNKHFSARKINIVTLSLLWQTFSSKHVPTEIILLCWALTPSDNVIQMDKNVRKLLYDCRIKKELPTSWIINCRLKWNQLPVTVISSYYE